MSSLYFDILPRQLPIVYRKEYNVKFMGLEKLHVFDSSKWGHIYEYLVEAGMLTKDMVTKPLEADEDDLLVVHSRKYLNTLKWSVNVARIAEVAPLVFVPNYFVQTGYLKPMRFQTGGSILAGKLAIDRGWAINIGGGFHHCSANKGAGFCPYADITLLIKFLFHSGKGVRNAMIVDLDAHQGNGYELDFLGDENVYILDMYNADIYPRAHKVKRAIRCKIELHCGTDDDLYIAKLQCGLSRAFSEFHPDVLIYNAGTDILAGDPLGLLRISDIGIMRRDELVFRICKEKKIPIVMLMSGGYLKRTARIIANSILNLDSLGYLPKFHNS
ncbi:histone deacetylase 11 [Arctopsyche grandis]|uniref:histone deacetylase 11 n=1 Tax=Arctopsyche grandis TaxID=121162 RepID=UPI00406D8A07